MTPTWNLHNYNIHFVYFFTFPLFLPLSQTQGDILTLLRQIDDNWYEGTVGEDKGIIPANYIQVFEASTEQQ